MEKIKNWPPKNLYRPGLGDVFQFYEQFKADIPKEIS